MVHMERKGRRESLLWLNPGCLLKDHLAQQDQRVLWVLQVYKALLGSPVTLVTGAHQDVLAYQGLMVYLVLLEPC